MLDPRGAGLHPFFCFFNFHTFVRIVCSHHLFVSLDQILVPTHSLRDKGTKGQRGRGTRGQRDIGTKGQREKGKKGQRDKGTKGQRDKGTKGQSDKGIWEHRELGNLGT